MKDEGFAGVAFYISINLFIFINFLTSYCRNPFSYLSSLNLDFSS